MPVREEDVLDSPNQSATLRLSDPDYMLVDISRRSLEIFPHGRVYKVFRLLSRIPLDMYNWSCVSVPCGRHVVNREKDDDCAKDYNRPTSRSA